MATVSYNNFLKGRKSTSALAHEWDSTYNNNARFGPKTGTTTTSTAATPTTPAPTFDPNVLDTQGESERNDLDTAHRGRLSNIDTNYNTDKAELDAQQPLIERTRDEGYEAADNNAASRGLFRSGIRDVNRGKVFRNFSDSTQALARRYLQLGNNRQQNLDTENANYQQSRTGISTNAYQRRYNKWTQGDYS